MKKYYRILKSDVEVKIALRLYLKVFEHHSKLIVKLTDSISNGDTNIDNHDFEKLTDALTEYYGISKSTISYYKRHPEENSLSEESLSSLRYIVDNYLKAKSSVEFIKAQVDQAVFLQSLDQPVAETEAMEVPTND